MVDLETCIQGIRDVVVVVDDRGAVLYASPSVERVLGYDPEAVVGDGVLEYVHPDDRDHVEAALQATTDESDDVVESVSYRVRHADGSWVPMETTSAVRRDPETGGYALVVNDVSERVALERDLERYEVILGSLDDGVYAIRPDGQIVYVNEAYASMKGVEREELLGTNIYDWGSPDAIEKIRPAREALETGEDDVGVVDLDFSTVEGGTIPVELRFSNVDRPGEQVERVGVIRDVSERQARERALREQNERLEAFASIVSHDLRNPLNVAQARVRQALDAGSTDGLASADESLSRMDEMVDDLLSLARDGRDEAERVPVDLSETAQAAWRTTATEDATLRIEDDATVTILAAPARLQNVLENLFRNAVEHGGDAVTVTVGRTDAGFSVADDGPGIPPDERDQVFETGYTTGDGGTGVGLGIVEQIADSHGWAVTVVEAEGGGARFEFTGVEVVEER